MTIEWALRPVTTGGFTRRETRNSVELEAHERFIESDFARGERNGRVNGLGDNFGPSEPPACLDATKSRRGR
jgi:hypothetical protein